MATLKVEHFVYTSTWLGQGFHVAVRNPAFFSKGTEGELHDWFIRLKNNEFHQTNNIVYGALGQGAVGVFSRIFSLDRDWKGRSGTYVSSLCFKLEETKALGPLGILPLARELCEGDSNFLRHETVVSQLEKASSAGRDHLTAKATELDVPDWSPKFADGETLVPLLRDSLVALSRVWASKPAYFLADEECWTRLSLMLLALPREKRSAHPFAVGYGPLGDQSEALKTCFWPPTAVGRYVESKHLITGEYGRKAGAEVEGLLKLIRQLETSSVSPLSFLGKARGFEDPKYRKTPSVYWKWLGDQVAFSRFLEDENYKQFSIEFYIAGLEYWNGYQESRLDSYLSDRRAGWIEDGDWLFRLISGLIESKDFGLFSKCWKVTSTDIGIALTQEQATQLIAKLVGTGKPFYIQFIFATEVLRDYFRAADYPPSSSEARSVTDFFAAGQRKRIASVDLHRLIDALEAWGSDGPLFEKLLPLLLARVEEVVDDISGCSRFVIATAKRGPTQASVVPPLALAYLQVAQRIQDVERFKAFHANNRRVLEQAVSAGELRQGTASDALENAVRALAQARGVPSAIASWAGSLAMVSGGNRSRKVFPFAKVAGWLGGVLLIVALGVLASQYFAENQEVPKHEKATLEWEAFLKQS